MNKLNNIIILIVFMVILSILLFSCASNKVCKFPQIKQDEFIQMTKADRHRSFDLFAMRTLISVRQEDVADYIQWYRSQDSLIYFLDSIDCSLVQNNKKE